MRRSLLTLAAILVTWHTPLAQEAKPDEKANANPCRDEVSTALQKLRKSSWFRMETNMITENGPTNMTIDYVLPDRMHQKVTVVATNAMQETILVGQTAWGTEGKGWQVLPQDITTQIITQVRENVLIQQESVGNYSCKGRTKFEGKDVLSYKLEDEPMKDSNAPKNEAYRMFYVDAITGLPVSNAILSPGREDKPLFKTSYSYPLDLKIDPPKDVVAPPASDATPAPSEKKDP
jgi:hypothetical protein